MAPGDILLAGVSFDRGASTTIAAPEGWNLIRRTDNGIKVGLSTYWKLAGGSEPASYTWGISPQRKAVGGIVHYSGVLAINPIDITSDATGHSSTASAPTITTSVTNEQVVAVFALNDNRTLGISPGMTEKFTVSNPDTNGPASSFDEMAQPAIGQVDPSSAFLGTPIRQWVAQQIALKPIPPVGTLRIIKNVINDNLGTSTPTNFSFQLNGASTTPFNANGENDFILSPGTYTVTELSSDRYTASYNNCANVVIQGGNTVTCTITNNDIPGALFTVRNIVEGGLAVPSDFFLFVGATPVQSGQQNLFPTGIYTVTTMGPGGYNITFGGDCDTSGNITLGLNQTKTCTITYLVQESTLALCTDGIDNDYDGRTDLFGPDCEPFIPRLSIVSRAINDNGGTFNGAILEEDIAVPNPDVPLPGTAVVNTYAGVYRGPPGLLKINPGAYGFVRYYVSIYGSDWGYSLSLSPDCSGTIVAGDSKVCTLTFDDVAPQLTVINHVVNDNGGTSAASDFTMNVIGTNVSATSFHGDETGTVVTLNAGSYDVNENILFGYTILSSEGCSGSMRVGETRTCMITNDDIPPALTLIKNLINDNGGTATSTDWTLSATGPTSISGAGGVTSETSNTFRAGTYALSESEGAPNYTASPWSCVGDVTNMSSNITIGIGQNSTCTITNDDNP